jgi:GNAT superfamily N-acetyltransferase
VIREATTADVPAIVEMGQRFIAQTTYRQFITANPVQMQTLVEWLIDTPTAALFVSASEDGTLTGMIGLAIMPHPITGDLFASELFWWVEPEHRGSGVRLLVAAEQWAREQRAVFMQMGAPTPAVGDLYAHRGYVPVETAYQRSL